MITIHRVRCWKAFLEMAVAAFDGLTAARGLHRVASSPPARRVSNSIRRPLWLAAFALTACGGGDPAGVPVREAAQGLSPQLSCDLDESDAVAIGIPGNSAPGHWLDHADLTIAVQAHPNSQPAMVEAIHAAIATWSRLLSDCLGNRVTLTDVTDAQPSQHRAADIVVHYVPRAGGNVWNGLSVCGDHRCDNVLVKSEYPLPMGVEIPPFAIGYVAMHEIGHALGLGHATNLWESNDLMGYGWAVAQGAPIVSRCDLEALRFVFSWVFEGAEPSPPEAGPYVCEQGSN